jgi:hypothetical protein
MIAVRKYANLPFFLQGLSLISITDLKQSKSLDCILYCLTFGCQVDVKGSQSPVQQMCVLVYNMHTVTPSWACVCASQDMNHSMTTTSCSSVQWMDRQQQMTVVLNTRLAQLPVSFLLTRLQHQKTRFSPDSTTHVCTAVTCILEQYTQQQNMFCPFIHNRLTLF